MIDPGPFIVFVTICGLMLLPAYVRTIMTIHHDIRRGARASKWRR